APPAKLVLSSRAKGGRCATNNPLRRARRSRISERRELAKQRLPASATEQNRNASGTRHHRGQPTALRWMDCPMPSARGLVRCRISLRSTDFCGGVVLVKDANLPRPPSGRFRVAPRLFQQFEHAVAQIEATHNK